MSSWPNKKSLKSACELQGGFHIHWKTQGQRELEKDHLDKKLPWLPGVPLFLLQDGDAQSTPTLFLGCWLAVRMFILSPFWERACNASPVSMGHWQIQQRNEAGLISIDNIQLWAGFRGGGLADVDKVQLWLVKLRCWEPMKREQLRKKQRKEETREQHALDEARWGEGSRGTVWRVCWERPCCSLIVWRVLWHLGITQSQSCVVRCFPMKKHVLLCLWIDMIGTIVMKMYS